MADEVTTGEIVRRLDDITRRLAEIANSLAEDRRHNSETYVRRDVFENGVQRRVQELEDDRDKQQDRNRQLSIAIISGAVLLILSLVVNLMGFQVGQ